MWIIAPNWNVEFLSFVRHEWHLNREVHRKPTVHTRSMLNRVGAVENVLIKFSGEVASKAMNLSLLLFNDELDAIEFFHRSIFSLAISLDFFLHFDIFLLGVRKMAERENLLWFVTAWESGRKYSHYIWQFKWIELLRDGYSCLQTLRCVEIYLVPNDLTGERDHIVGVWIRNEDAAGLQEFGSRV